MKKILFVFGLLILVNSVSFGQLNYYLKIDGIQGEATEKGYDNWIKIEAFTQSIEKEAPRQGNRGSNAIFSTLNVSKVLDVSSVKIAEAVAKGLLYKNVEIACVKNGMPFYSCALANVIMTSYSISGVSSERPFEEIAFSFETIKVTYSQISSKTGKEEGKVNYKFDTIRQ